MQHSPTNNAITRRLAKMQDLYMTVYIDKQARICIWNIEPDEARMVDVFFKTEISEGGVFDEFFLQLNSPFILYDGYETQLLGEFKEKLANSKHLLEEENIELDFKVLERMNRGQSFFDLVENFRKVIHPEDGGIVIFLAPKSISDFNKFEQWFYAALKSGWPEKLRLMLSYAGTDLPFQNIRADFPEAIKFLQPNLDMEGAMRELAEGGDPGDPSVKMRKLLLEMNIAASKGDLDKAEIMGEEAITFSKTQPNMEHIEPTVYSILGSFAYSKPGNEEAALRQFSKSTQAAKKAHAEGSPLGMTMIYQSTFSYGSTLIQQGNYAEAATMYEQAADAGAGDTQTVYQRMEAYRMAGICYYNQNDGEKCWDCNWLALDLAETLDMQMRSYSALPYIGEVMVYYAHQMGRTDSAAIVESRMVNLLGKSWRDQLAQKKQKEHASR